MTGPRRLGLGLLLLLPPLLLAALWFGPRLTDWNEHRDRLAILAAGRLGQPVMLTGPVRLTLLPQPMLEAGGVTIGQAGDDRDGGLSIQARALRLRLDLGALLRLRLEPREVVLVGAEIRLPWPPTAAQSFSGQSFRPPPWLTGLRGRIEDSRITLGSVPLEQVTADLAAGGVADALRIDGRFRWRGLDAGFRTTLGRPGDDDAAPLDLTVSAASASLSASGVLLPQGGFEGTLQGGGSDWAALLPGPAGPFRLRGRLSATADLLTADDLALDIAGSPARGAATLRLAPEPRLDLSLVTGRVALDPWVAALRQAQTNASQSNAPQAAARSLPFGIDLSAEAATLGGVTLRRLRAAALLDGERLTLSDVAAILPGDTAIELSGTSTGRPGAGGRLETAIRFQGGALRATLLALGARLDRTEPTLLRAGEGRMRLVLEDSQAAMPEFAATIDGARVSGAGVLRFGSRPALGLGLSFDRLDLDAWLPERADLLELATGNTGWDANLRLAAEQANWRGTLLERLSVDAALEAGRLTARRVAARLAGGEVALSGVLSPATPAAPMRLADGVLELSAPVARPMLALLPATWPAIRDAQMPIAGQPLALRLSASGPLTALLLRAGLDLGEARMEANGTLDAQARRYAGTLTLRHPGAPRFAAEALRMTAPDWLGEGSFSAIATLAATPRGGQLDSIELVAGELRASGQLALALAPAARPRLTGRIQAERLPLPAPLGGEEPLPLAALRLLDAELALTATRVLPPYGPTLTQAGATLRLTGGVLQLDQFQAHTAGGRAEGAAVLDATATPPLATAQLRLTGVALSGPLTGLPLDVAAGQLDTALDLRATGHSPAAMLSTLAGTVQATLRGGVLAGVDLGAALAAAARPEGAEPLRRAMAGGATAFDQLETTLRLSGGRAILQQGAIGFGEHATATASGELDLARGGLDLTLTLAPPEGPPFGLRLTGPWRQPRRVPDLADWLRWQAAQP